MKTFNNEEAAQAIAKLTPGQSMIANVRKVSGGKFHIELAEKIVKNSGTINVLGILNAGDSRFNSGGARRAWAPAEKAMLVEMLAMDESVLDSLKESGEPVNVCMLNPTINGIQLRVQVKETIEGTEYDNANIEKMAKRAGKDGDILTHEGLPIFSKTYVVGTQEGEAVQHSYLLSDQEASRKANAMIGASASSAAPSLD